MESDAFDILKICQPSRVYNLKWNKGLTLYREDRKRGHADSNVDNSVKVKLLADTNPDTPEKINA